MPAYANLQGAQLVEMHELQCVCGKAPHHVVARQVNVSGVANAFSVQLRGWCLTCSPVVATVYEFEQGPEPSIWRKWWQRLLRTA